MLQKEIQYVFIKMVERRRSEDGELFVDHGIVRAYSTGLCLCVFVGAHHVPFNDWQF